MSKINYAFAKDGSDIEKVQDKAIRAANNARVQIQIALVATIAHLAQFRDVRIARRLVDGLHETVRGKALVDYLVRFGHLTVGKIKVTDDKGKETEVDSFTGFAVKDAKEYAALVASTFNGPEGAKEVYWWTLKVPNPYKGFSLEQALQSVLAMNKKAQEKVEKGEAQADQINMEVNDKTIRAVLALANFDAIVADEAQAA